MTHAVCPLQPEMDTLLTQSQDFFAAIRRLRRRCKACPACTRPEASPQAKSAPVHSSQTAMPVRASAAERLTCPFWQEFNAQIRQATSEVIAELSK